MSQQMQTQINLQKIIDKYEEVIFELSCKLEAKDRTLRDYEAVMKILGTAVRNSKEREVVYNQIINNVNNRRFEAEANLNNISQNAKDKGKNIDKEKEKREKRIMEIYNETNRVKAILAETLGTTNLDDLR